ncbi:MAG: BON domain-containing protein [Methylosarcina sp.]
MMKPSLGVRRFFMGFLFVALMAGCATSSIEENTEQYLNDSAITSSVQKRIFNDPELKHLRINVETHQGVVQLSGFVDSTQISARAEELARSVKGVSDVKNSLIVKESD